MPLQKLLAELDCKTQELEWPDWWYFGKERGLVKGSVKVCMHAHVQVLPACRFSQCPLSNCHVINLMLQDEELERLHELFATVGELPQPDEDISAAQWLRKQGASERMLAGMPSASCMTRLSCDVQGCIQHRPNSDKSTILTLRSSLLMLRSGRGMLCKRLRLLAGAAGTVRDDHREPALGLRRAPIC
jgi:hypothetical protein